MVNHLQLAARLERMEALRHTPVGLPALDFWLEHESRQTEAGQPRTVQARMRALALGTVAERLVQQELGSQWSFSGFVGSRRGARSVIFHVLDFQHIAS